MKTLIIYDNNGRIWVQMPGSYVVPTGIPFLEVEIPEGKYPMSVDVSGTTPTVVYGEIPKSAETARLELLESAVNDILMGGGF